ncbi:Calpain-like protease palB/RIM13 [Diplonema papillatum]|nr:Calpain-like protease palB/RIM13 [Diplonema papillatum]
MGFEECLAAVDAAMKADEKGEADAAVEKYRRAAESIMRLLTTEEDKRRKDALKKNAAKCMDRAEELMRSISVSRATALERQAKIHEVAGEYTKAKDKYTEAAQVLLDRKRQEDQRNAPAIALLAQQIAKNLELATLLQTLSSTSVPNTAIEPAAGTVLKSSSSVSYTPSPETEILLRRAEHGQASLQQQNPPTKTEMEFLKASSVVCGARLPMWDDPREGYPVVHPLGGPLYSDMRPPKLAQKQVEHGGTWMRPVEFLPAGIKPSIITGRVDPLDIVQSVVGNCSYVCSLTVAANYERRFPQARLISSAMFPQDVSGNPVFNPSGKYAIKLLINGIVRMVIIDDRIVAAKGKGWVGGPMGGHAVETQGHSPLCGHCASGDLWVSLYEKAYLKVFGGDYKFPGSTSSTDLYHLCGWIPEKVDLTGEEGKEFDRVAEWKRLHTAHGKGLMVATVGTAARDVMPASWEEKLGLIAGHAYSVLDFKEAEGRQFLKMMNPWRQHRWMGRFSHQDNRNWTPSLEKSLAYDRKHEDNGVFWIEWTDAVKFFSRLNLSWKPHSFNFRFARHFFWKNAMSENGHYFRCPQYELRVQSASGPSGVWLLLVRHLLPTFEEELPFVTLHVFDTTGLVSNLRIPLKFVLPKERCLQEGTYRNASMSLARVAVPQGLSKFNVIVSCLQPRVFPHSLTVYSPFKSLSLERIPDVPFRHEKSLRGEWIGESAGGRCGLPSWKNNPQYRITLKEESPLVISVELVKQLAVGITICSLPLEELREQKPSLKGHIESVRTIVWRSGAYVSAFACINTAIPPHEPVSDPPPPHILPPGLYTIIPTTFNANEISPFKLSVFSPHLETAASLEPIPRDAAG